MIGGAFLGGGVELVPAGQCKLELQIMTEDRQNLTGTFTITDGTHTYSAVAGSDGRATVNVVSGGTYTVSVSNTGYDNVTAQKVVTESASIKYVRFELFTSNVKVSTAQSITGDKTFKGVILGDYSNGVKYNSVVTVDTPILILRGLENSANLIMYRTSTGTKVRINARNASNTWAQMDLIVPDSGSSYVTAPNRVYASASSSDVLVKGHVGSITDLVHTTGNETIAGEKTLKNGLKISRSKPFVTFIDTGLSSMSERPDDNRFFNIYFTANNGDYAAYIRPSINANGNNNLLHRIYGEDGDYGFLQINANANGDRFVEASSRDYDASNTNDVVVIGHIATITDLVHTTGNENIAGKKTFGSDVLFHANTNSPVTIKGYAPYLNYIATATNIAQGIYSVYETPRLVFASGDEQSMGIVGVYHPNSSVVQTFVRSNLRDSTGTIKAACNIHAIAKKENNVYMSYSTTNYRTYSPSNTTDIVTNGNLESRLSGKIRYGTSDPQDSVGIDGDIYIKYEA